MSDEKRTDVRYSKTVGTPTKAMQAGMDARALPHDLMGGTDAMQAAGTRWLPKYPNESEGVYKARLKQTILYNAFAETTARQAGKLFIEPIDESKVAASLAELLENVDGQDRALTPYAFDLAHEGFVDGIAYIFVDYPTLGAGASVADAQKAGAQPYWVEVCADQVFGIQSENVGGKQVLTAVRIYQCTEEVDPEDEFSTISVERVRVYKLVKPDAESGGNPSHMEVEVWVKVAPDKSKPRETRWMLEDVIVTTMPVIPLAPFYVNRTGFMEGRPPLRTLAELNLEHWQSTSAQRNSLTYSRFAMLACIGVDKPKPIMSKDGQQTGMTQGITVGPSKTLYGPVNADFKYIEPTGAGVEAGAKDLEAIERRMSTASMDVRVENAGDVTATAAAIDSNESNAALKGVAKSLKDCIDTALSYSMMWINGSDEGGEVSVFDDFGDIVVNATLAELLQLRVAGEISQPTFWTELSRRRILGPEFDPKKEAELIEVDQENEMKKMEEAMKIAKANGAVPADPNAPPGSQPPPKKDEK